eukprot:GHVN01067828.1.p1 GENE.GHVN01067828.1~~GHVN01067828.1.p1  ORF type:complete len:986 (+),score=57.41 GHVN01067828.1:200-3157(+)
MPKTTREERSQRRASDDPHSPPEPALTSAVPTTPTANMSLPAPVPPVQPGYLSPLEKSAVTQFEESLTQSSEDKWRYEEWQRVTRRSYVRCSRLVPPDLRSPTYEARLALAVLTKVTPWQEQLISDGPETALNSVDTLLTHLDRRYRPNEADRHYQLTQWKPTYPLTRAIHVYREMSDTLTARNALIPSFIQAMPRESHNLLYALVDDGLDNVLAEADQWAEIRERLQTNEQTQEALMASDDDHIPRFSTSSRGELPHRIGISQSTDPFYSSPLEPATSAPRSSSTNLPKLTPAQRSENAKKAAATRKRNANAKSSSRTADSSPQVLPVRSPKAPRVPKPPGDPNYEQLTAHVTSPEVKKMVISILKRSIAAPMISADPDRDERRRRAAQRLAADILTQQYRNLNFPTEAALAEEPDTDQISESTSGNEEVYLTMDGKGDRITTTAWIDGKERTAIIDTGARSTFIPSDWAKNVQKSPSNVVTISGDHLPIFTTTSKCVVALGGQQVTLTPRVIQTSLNAAVIGRDALKQAGLLRHFTHLITRPKEAPQLPVSELKDSGRPTACKVQSWADQVQARAVQKRVNDLERDNIIERTEPSGWCSRIAMIPKPHGPGQRFIINLRDVNAQVKPMAYTGAPAADVAQKLAQYPWRARLDVRAAFHQVELPTANRAWTSFRSPDGNWFRFKKLPMGFINSPTSHNHHVAHLLRAQPGIHPYVDDIGVGGKSRQECQERVNLVRRLLAPMDLPLNQQRGPTTDEVVFAGHRVGYLTLTPINHHANLRPPKDRRGVRALLGALNWVRHSVPHFTHRTRAMSSHLRHQAPVWSKEADRELQWLNSYLSTPKTQPSSDATKPLTLTTDASSQGMGAVVQQGRTTLWTDQRAFTPTETRYTAYERELQAILWALKRTRHILRAGPVIVRTDNKALSRLNGDTAPTTRLQRQLHQLEQVGAQLEYVPGKDNPYADYLSRTSTPILPVSRNGTHACTS